MGSDSGIEWTDHTWNPWRGCTRVSPGCDNCYMMRDAARYGLAGETVQRAARATFGAPLAGQPGKWKWADGSRVFVCSWSDFFHPDADGWRDEAWDIIRGRPELTFLILTKRPERMGLRLPADWGNGWRNVWLGVTAENQEQADARIPQLLGTPAAVRFLSIEPMLGPVNFRWTGWAEKAAGETYREYLARKGICDEYEGLLGIDWIIVGGESGPNARPMHPDWARQVRDQCAFACVPFYFKQWGEWAPNCLCGKKRPCRSVERPQPGKIGIMFRCGKKKSGCRLDGREYREFPAEAAE